MAGRAADMAESDGAGNGHGIAVTTGDPDAAVAASSPPSPPAPGKSIPTVQSATTRDGRDQIAGPAKRPSGMFSGLRPFSSAAYRYMWVGTALTMTGNFMQQVAQ